MNNSEVGEGCLRGDSRPCVQSMPCSWESTIVDGVLICLMNTYCECILTAGDGCPDVPGQSINGSATLYYNELRIALAIMVMYEQQ